MTTARRNKGYYRRDLDRAILQVKEDIPKGGAKRPTFWTIPKDEGN